MKRLIIIGIILLAVASGGYYVINGSSDTGSEERSPPPGGGFGRGPGGPRTAMTVELGSVTRGVMAQQMTVVGNLIGAQTVAATPKISGRLASVSVRLGDRVARGQTLAKIEDQEIREQVKQAEASAAVARATIRQREADLGLARTNLDRARNLSERQLIPRQTLDDAEARYQAAAAQLELAQAQNAQSQARLDELKINLANTEIVSAVNGFVGSRTLDPGAWVTPNTTFISVVEINVVRMVANVVEKDLRRITAGQRADVEVDAFPGEHFPGRVAHVAPVLDPATRTAQIEIEIENPQFRLKPGMYARVNFTVDKRENVLVVPTSAVVAVGSQQGVFLPGDGGVARFKPVEVGMRDDDFAEVSGGLQEGEQVITTGAAALREGDRILLQGRQPGGSGRERADGQGGLGPESPTAGGGPQGSSGRQGSGLQGRGAAPTGNGQD